MAGASSHWFLALGQDRHDATSSRAGAPGEGGLPVSIEAIPLASRRSRWHRGDPVGIEAIPLALGLAGYRAIARGLIVGLAGRMR
jgi:hypothetical protein